LDISEVLIIINYLFGTLFILINIKDCWLTLKTIITAKKFKSIGSITVLLGSLFLMVQQFFVDLNLSLRLIYISLSVLFYILLSIWLYSVYRKKIPKQPFYNAFINGKKFDDLLINLIVVICLIPTYMTYKDSQPLDIEFRIITHNPRLFFKRQDRPYMKVRYELILVNNTGKNIDVISEAIHSSYDYRLNDIINLEKDPIDDFVYECVYYYQNKAFVPINSYGKFPILEAIAEIPNFYNNPVNVKDLNEKWKNKIFSECKIPPKKDSRSIIADYSPYKYSGYNITNDFYGTFRFYWRARISVKIDKHEIRHYIFRGVLCHDPLVVKNESEEFLTTGHFSDVTYVDYCYYIRNKNKTKTVSLYKAYVKVIDERLPNDILNDFRVSNFSIGQHAKNIFEKRILKEQLKVCQVFRNPKDRKYYEKQIMLIKNDGIIK